jgi:hypothetical protein
MTLYYHCNYCNKDNHTEDRCCKKKNGFRREDLWKRSVTVHFETALIAHSKSDGLLHNYIFNSDSVAASHMVMMRLL